MKKILVFPIIFSIIFSAFILVNNPTQADTLWFVSDVHVGAGSHPETNGDFWDAINDTESIGVDYAFIIGDLVYDIPVSPSDWVTFHNIWDELDEVIYKNYTIGNHDCDWETYSRLSSISYTYAIGNTLIISIGDEGTTPTTGGDADYSTQLSWLNSTVQANSDKNIIVLSHHPINDTTYYTNTPVTPIDEYQGFIDWIESSGDYHINAWLNGHHHLTKDGTYDVIMEQDDIVFANIGSIATWGTHPSNYPESTYWDFTNDSTQVVVRAYEHTGNTWYSNSEFPYYFNLTYPFSMEEDIHFASINDATNNSDVVENNRWFNWTSEENATTYSIRIANDSAFTDIFLQLDNITITDGWCTNNFLNTSASGSPYEYNYWEDSALCHYYLPYVYNITFYDYHYYQVRSYGTQ